MNKHFGCTFLDVKGHFPSKPVMPGVLQIEALAQTGALLLLSEEKYRGKIGYITGVDKVKPSSFLVPWP